MKTKNTSGATITFETTCQQSPIWDNFGYITTQIKFTNPIDYVIEGDYSGTEKGWDSSDDADAGMPRLGRTELYGSYQSYVISVANRSATLAVDCFGNSFLGDVYILYDYSADKFYDDGTSNERTNINLYDAPEYLQPTSPQNFRCTNPTAYGRHPHFEWETPEEPDGVTFYYNIIKIWAPAIEK